MLYTEIICLSTLYVAINICAKKPQIQSVKIQQFLPEQRWFSTISILAKCQKITRITLRKGDQRQDDPFHWGTGPYAGVVALTFKPKAIFMIGFDLYDKETKD